jgi:hypothetical protein
VHSSLAARSRAALPSPPQALRHTRLGAEDPEGTKGPKTPGKKKAVATRSRHTTRRASLTRTKRAARRPLEGERRARDWRAGEAREGFGGSRPRAPSEKKGTVNQKRSRKRGPRRKRARFENRAWHFPTRENKPHIGFFLPVKKC